MSCRSWSDAWIAAIYDESSPEEARQFELHVESCGACRKTVEQLRSTRELLREHAPEIPASRPLLVLGSAGNRWHPAWAFAAGLAAASVLFGAGTWIASPASRSDPVAARPDRAEPAATVPADDSETFAQIMARLDRIEGDRDTNGSLGQTVHPETLRVELERLERRLRREYRNELEQLAVAFAASERRTDAWIDDARDAIQVLALRQDPRLTER